MVDNVVATGWLWLGHAAAGSAKPLVSEGLPHLSASFRGFFTLFYRAALSLSSRTLNFTAGGVRRHLQMIGSRWRKLNPGQEALLVLRDAKRAGHAYVILDGTLIPVDRVARDKPFYWPKVPYKGKKKPEPQKQANRAHAKLRALGERANAQLKTWKVLSKLGCCPWRAGKLADWLSGETVLVEFPDACAVMTVTCDRLPFTATCTA